MPSLISILPVIVICLILQQICTSMIAQLIYIVVSVSVYCGVLMLFPKERNILLNLRKYLKR